MEEKIINPFEIMPPENRWRPTKEQQELFGEATEKLMPPLVEKIRQAVYQWRLNKYKGATETSKQLLNFWFEQKHDKTVYDIQKYFFLQREAIESIIYMYEVAKALDKYEMLRFHYDTSKEIANNEFPENWTRYVIKAATGSGKTKIMVLAIVWAYFNKLYEKNSTLSKNQLVIAPNIIVLNRLKKDFEGLKAFKKDPAIPGNGYFDRNWKNDFKPIIHFQDELKPISDDGNIFLTNIHRVYLTDTEPTQEEYYLGNKPKSDADKAKGLDLGKILRSTKIKDIVVLNDEAHHIHDHKMQWFKSIKDINNQLKLKQGKNISVQIDFTATPKHTNGSIFVQTISDFPLVEAINQNIVKSPVLPDEKSRSQLKEKISSKFTERYREFIGLGVHEWKLQYEEFKSQKTPLLFIMTTNTKEADETKEFLEKEYEILKNAVLVIHTNQSGDIKETGTSKKDKEKLEKLRKAADNVDSPNSPYKAIVSVMMLREGWDVRNVSTIVGLRPYKAKAKILPEQTLGRGLRKMFGFDRTEELVVVGSPAFIEFVEEIKKDGVKLGYRSMGGENKKKNSIFIEIDKKNKKKDMEMLNIVLPVLSPRIYRDFKDLSKIDENSIGIKTLKLKKFSDKDLKKIVFRDINNKISHITEYSDTVPDYRNVIKFFTNNILQSVRMFSGFEQLYPKVENFIKTILFGKEVKLSEAQTIKNLAEPEAKKIIYDTFKTLIDKQTIKDNKTAKLKSKIHITQAKPFFSDSKKFLPPVKSAFNKIIGDSDFELDFSAFLDTSHDIISFAKNYLSLNFRMEYQGEDGNLHDYYPDFFVKENEKSIYIIETKGREDLDDIRKIKRLKTWCEDVNNLQNEIKYIPIYIKQKNWDKYREDIRKFADIKKLFNLKK